MKNGSWKMYLWATVFTAKELADLRMSPITSLNADRADIYCYFPVLISILSGMPIKKGVTVYTVALLFE
jgi:hypothetical protein